MQASTTQRRTSLRPPPCRTPCTSGWTPGRQTQRHVLQHTLAFQVRFSLTFQRHVCPVCGFRAATAALSQFPGRTPQNADLTKTSSHPQVCQQCQ
jgi:hypothetical protein